MPPPLRAAAQGQCRTSSAAASPPQHSTPQDRSSPSQPARILFPPSPHTPPAFPPRSTRALPQTSPEPHSSSYPPSSFASCASYFFLETTTSVFGKDRSHLFHCRTASILHSSATPSVQ